MKKSKLMILGVSLILSASCIVYNTSTYIMASEKDIFYQSSDESKIEANYVKDEKEAILNENKTEINLEQKFETPAEQAEKDTEKNTQKQTEITTETKEEKIEKNEDSTVSNESPNLGKVRNRRNAARWTKTLWHNNFETHYYNSYSGVVVNYNGNPPSSGYVSLAEWYYNNGFYYYPRTIGYRAFTNNKKNFDKLGLNYIRRVEDFAFQGMQSLTRVDLERVEHIGQFAFASTSLKEGGADEKLILPAATTIKDQAFRETKLKRISFPKVTDLGGYAFYNTITLTEADLPEVISIGEQAFKDTKLSKISMPKVQSIGAFSFIETLLTDVSLPNIRTLEIYAFAQMPNLRTVSLGNNLKEIPSYLFFRNNNLSNVTLSNTLTRIGESAFYETNLSGINFPSSLTTISNYAFSKSFRNGSANITIPDSVRSIGREAFSNNSNLNYVKLPQNTSYNKIEEKTFLNTGLVRLDIPVNVKTIGVEAFRNNSNLREVKMPEVTTIENGAFSLVSNNNIVNIEMKVDMPKVTSIGDEAFKNSTLTNLEAPNVKTIGANAFNGSKLETVVLNEVTTIKTGAFANNSNLHTVVIPKAITIEAGAFVGCPNLEKIVLNGDVQITSNSNNYTTFSPNTVVTINRLRDDKSKDANWERWSSNSTNIQFVNSPFNYEKDISGTITLTGFENGKASVQPNIITIPSKFTVPSNSGSSTMAQDFPIKKIKRNAFANNGNSSVKKIIISEGITEIQENAFSNTANQNMTLEEVALPNTLEILEPSVFANNKNLKKVNIPNNSALNYIGDNTFMNTGLENIVLPSNIKTIGENAFKNTELKGVLTLSNVERLEKGAFENNDEIHTIIMPEVTSIEENAFRNDTDTQSKLYLVSMPKINFIGVNAFANNHNFKSISNTANPANMPDSLRVIKAGALVGTGFDTIELNGNVEIIPNNNEFKTFEDTTEVIINRVKDDEDGGYDQFFEMWGAKAVKYLDKPTFNTSYEVNPNGSYKVTISLISPKKLSIDLVEKPISNQQITIQESDDFISASNPYTKERKIVLDNIPKNIETTASFTVKSFAKTVANYSLNTNKKIDYLMSDGTTANLKNAVSGIYYPDRFKVQLPEIVESSIPAGLIFIGWSESKDFSTGVYPVGTEVTVNGNLTLYAVIGNKMPASNIFASKLESPTEKITEKKIEKTTEKVTEKKIEKTTEKVTEKKTESTTQKVTEEKKTKNTTQKVTEEKKTKNTTQKVTEKKTENTTQKTIEQRATEKMTEKLKYDKAIPVYNDSNKNISTYKPNKHSKNKTSKTNDYVISKNNDTKYIEDQKDEMIQEEQISETTYLKEDLTENETEISSDIESLEEDSQSLIDSDKPNFSFNKEKGLIISLILVLGIVLISTAVFIFKIKNSSKN